MLKIVSTACAAVMALTAPFAAPAMAMPLAAPEWGPNLVIQAQADGSSPNTYPGPGITGGWDRNWDRDDRWDRRAERWERREERRERRAERRADRYAYWRGHRGYRDYRPGYRRHGDFWFPPAAFIAGAIIGGAIASGQARSGGDAHVQWCYDRYRSYRASDNTYQPYNGPRRQCNSPYG